MNALLIRLRRLILGFLRVPSEPHPPTGSPGSLRIFRAGESYARLLFWGWVGKQVLLALPFLFWISIGVHLLPEEITLGSRKQGTLRKVPTTEFREWLLMIEIPVVVFGILQMPFTYVLMRLRYEQHWYIVTDRSLRVREGITTVRETTLSFANIQNISVGQNPVQRLFGLSSVEVKSAGGGGASTAQGHAPTDGNWHTAVFRNVDNPEEIRDLILRHQRTLKESGLGDPEDHSPYPPAHPQRPTARPTAAPTIAMASEETLAAARELLTEFRGLRRTLDARKPGHGPA
jgi:hypothetical protein